MKLKLMMVLLAGALLAGCNEDKPAGGGGPKGYPYKVVTTVGMVSDIVRNVAGDKAAVTGLMPEGSDPHQYSPSRNDVVALRQADVVFYNGLMLEGKMGDTLVSIARDGKPVYAVTELIDRKELLEPEEMAGHPDPHVWMDASIWARTVDVVADALGKYDPANKDLYRKNADAYTGELRKLDAYAKQCVSTIPEKGRVLITAHDAFNYFGRAYGLEVRGIQGISTESEAAVRDIENLVKLIVDRDIKAVFVESSVPEKNVRALVEGAQSRGKSVKIGGELFSDAMGPAGTYEGTYIGMIDHNVTVITRALGGNAPEKGMQGKLK